MSATKSKSFPILISAILIINLLTGSFNTEIVRAAALWEYVGAAGFSVGDAFDISLALGSDDTPYVAFSDEDDGRKVTLMKYNGTDWESVGTVGFSAGHAGFTSLALGSSDTPYVAYADRENADKATLMKYNGTTWEAVGAAGFSAGETFYTSLALDSNDTPYVAYTDRGNGDKATLMTYNGATSTWESVGSPGFSTGSAWYTFLVLDSEDKPYVAFRDDAHDKKATVMKYNGTDWETVGAPGFSAGIARYISIALDSQDTPYITYRDDGTGGRITVMKYNGANWENVGAAGFSSGTGYFPSIALDSDDIPYVAYQAPDLSWNAALMKYNGTDWESIGSPYFSTGGASYTSLALDSNGTPYVAYRDGGASLEASVMRYNAPNLQATQTNDTAGTSTVGATFNWTINLSNNGEDSAIFSDGTILLKDELPTAATYGAPATLNFTNITNSGNIYCSINKDPNGDTLICQASGGDVTLGAKSGAFDITFSVTPQTIGTLTNPRNSGVCQADPTQIITEVNEMNNNCQSDAVTVAARNTPELDVQGNSFPINDGDTTPDETDGTDFGITSVDSGSVTRTFTIRNSGAAELTISSLELIGVAVDSLESLDLSSLQPNLFASEIGGTAFTITAHPATSIPAGETTTFKITFDPDSASIDAALIIIASNDSDENPYTFAVQGIGSLVPSNDTFTKAKRIIELQYTDDLPTSFATLAGDDPDLTECGISGQGQATVWYEYTPTANDTVAALAIDTFDSDYDTFIAVWTGEDKAHLTLVACNDDANDTGQSALAFQVDQDVTYYIEIGQP